MPILCAKGIDMVRGSTDGTTMRHPLVGASGVMVLGILSGIVPRRPQGGSVMFVVPRPIEQQSVTVGLG